MNSFLITLPILIPLTGAAIALLLRNTLLAAERASGPAG